MSSEYVLVRSAGILKQATNRERRSNAPFSGLFLLEILDLSLDVMCKNEVLQTPKPTLYDPIMHLLVVSKVQTSSSGCIPSQSSFVSVMGERGASERTVAFPPALSETFVVRSV
jgi:hypothetical protein